jgi:hypothetical protein
MLLAAILLVFSVPQNGNTVAEKNSSATVSEVTVEDSSVSHSLPSAPEPKGKADEVSAPGGDSGTGVNAGAVVPAATLNLTPAVEPRYSLSAPMSISPSKAFIGRPYETPVQRKLWYALSFTGSGLAAADAWSTRRAITQGYGVEGNPMLRPFSHSSVLYGATQVSPLVMDFIGKRMMVSQHGILRKAWWLPQLAGSGMSTFAVVHNVRLVP